MAIARIAILLFFLSSFAGCKVMFVVACQKDIYQGGDPFPYQTEAKIQVERDF